MIFGFYGIFEICGPVARVGLVAKVGPVANVGPVGILGPVANVGLWLWGCARHKQKHPRKNCNFIDMFVIL